MEPTYTYSIVGDFDNGLDSYQLHQEIVADSGITVNLVAVETVGDAVNIVFVGALSEPEQLVLDGIVEAHIPEPDIGEHIWNQTVEMRYVTDTVFNTALTFNFPGTNVWNPTNFRVLSEMDEGGVSYNVRLLDLTNNNVICSRIISDENLDLYDLGTLSDLPANGAMFDLQLSVNGDSSAMIRDLVMYYD